MTLHPHHDRRCADHDPEYAVVVYNEDLRARLDAHRKEKRLTLRSLGRKIGYSEPVISRYLSSKPDHVKVTGDVDSIEAAVADYLRKTDRLTVFDLEPFDTYATRMAFAVFESARRLGRICLICGHAGIGKSVSIRMYAAEHPTCVAIEVARWSSTERGLIGLLWDECDTRKWAKNISRSKLLLRHFRNSERLILIDNAHKLRRAALAWLFDFWDQTGVSIGLVGNPEILENLRYSDQMFSRIAMRKDLCVDGEQRLKLDWLDQAADGVVDRMWSDAPQEVREMAREAAREFGHLRTLQHRIQLAQELAATSQFRGKPADAFDATHAMIVARED